MSTTHPASTDLAASLAETINLIIHTDLINGFPRFGDRRLYIGPALDYAAEQLALMGLPSDRPTLELALVEANRRHLLTLGRADHVAAMDRQLLNASHIHNRGSDFHFVVIG